MQCFKCGSTIPDGQSLCDSCQAQATQATGADRVSRGANDGATPPSESLEGGQLFTTGRIVAAVVVVLIVAWAYFSNSAQQVLVLALPVLLACLVPLLSLDSVTEKTESAETWLTQRRDKARGKEGKFAKYFSRPLYGGCLWIYKITSGIADPHLRGGARVAAMLYFVWIMVALLVTVAYLVVIVVIIGLVLWAISAILGSSSDRGSSGDGEMVWTRAKTSRVKEGFFGDKRVEHYDDRGRKVAETRHEEGFLGLDPHDEHVDAAGRKIGESREKEGFLGLDPHEEHVDASGRKVGETRHKDGFLGLDPHEEHVDTEGDVVAESREDDGFLGLDPHSEHSQK